MKGKLTIILLCLAIGISGAFTSCKNDAPDIFVKTQSSHESKFQGIVSAINDETATLDDRLNTLFGALVDIDITLSEKLDLIELAIQRGITTYEECAQKLIDAVNRLNDTEEAKLQAIHDILADTNASLAAKLALIEAAVKAGTATYEECAQKLIEALNAMNTSLDAKLQAIYDILKANEATIDAKLALIEAAINNGVGTYKDYAQKLIDEIKALDRSQAGKLQAIRDILESGLGSVSLKVEAAKIAIEEGFISKQEAVAALKDAIVKQLKDNDTALDKSIDDITEAIKEIKKSIDGNFELTKNMIDLLTRNLADYLTRQTTTITDALTAVEDAIKLLSENFNPEAEESTHAQIISLLEQIKQAIINGNDYSELIAAIKALTPQPEPEPEPDPVPDGFVDLGITRAMVYGEDCENPKKRIVFAEKNLGAAKAADPGLYFRWGELNGWKVFGDEAGTLTSSNCVQYDKDGKTTGVSFTGSTFKSNGWNLSNKTDVEDFVGRTDLVKDGTTYGDAATYILGEGFRMMDETLARAILTRGGRDKLRNAGIIDIAFDIQNEGIWLVNNDTKANIFFPYGGKLVENSRDYHFTAGEYATMYQWTTAPNEDGSWSFYQTHNYGGTMENSGRFQGLNIRAVTEIN